MSAPTLHYSEFNNVHDATPKAKAATWPQLAALLTTHTVGDKDGPCIVPGRFVNGHRSKENIQQRWFAMLDIERKKVREKVDGKIVVREVGPYPPPPQDIVARLLARGWLGAVYSSHSHETGKPRSRVVVVLSAPFDFDCSSKDAHDTSHSLDKRAMQRLAEELDLLPWLDTSKAGGESLMHLPRHPRRAEFFAEVVDGQPINTDVLYAAALADDVEAGPEPTAREQAADDAARERCSSPAIDRFNATHRLEDLLARYGYKRERLNSPNWRSPHQTSASYATEVLEGNRWRSLSDSDRAAGLGHDNGTSVHGDAFDLFVHFKHGGDFTGALSAADGLGAERPPPAEACSLAEAHNVFQRWLGDGFDMDTLDVVLAVAAAESLDGDPVWLLVVGGSGAAKTEVVQSTSQLGAHIVSTLTSEAALLSASPRRQRVKGATGGLLRQIGERGILVIKDMTSILSGNRDMRATILAALREIHDGKWVRNVGSDGGQTLEWTGRLVIIGACTTAWDTHHAAIATMGDRFVLIRPDSREGRIESGRQAMANTGRETEMRQEMAAAVAGVVAGMANKPYELTAQDNAVILEAANIVTLARTGVEMDYRGDVIDAHAPEMPTRFAKQLTQIMRGAMAIGMHHNDALRLVLRCARDSMPPLRLAVLQDLNAYVSAKVINMRQRLQKPRATVDRVLQALHFLGLLVCTETPVERAGKTVQERSYRLSEGIAEGLAALVEDAEHVRARAETRLQAEAHAERREEAARLAIDDQWAAELMDYADGG